ncbi:hypothetical protein ApAK_03985 [Thermoplasmatales archaeon AK]|nr:hypothetical protein [Thermoplasmatales archaeon AK]
MTVEITSEPRGARRSRLFCPMKRPISNVFFSLVDYRNNYFTSDEPSKIVEFYDGFENREQLIQWMKERPKGVANIHEVEGDKDIIVVIPTADFNGKYAKECRENIFKGLHMIFVESGGKGDFYFNYAHNCNVGIRKAMEYNPTWVVVSNDDVYPIDPISRLTSELKLITPYNTVVLKKDPNNLSRALRFKTFEPMHNAAILKPNVSMRIKFSLYYRINFSMLLTKFSINFLGVWVPKSHLFLLGKQKTIPGIGGSFSIYSADILRKMPDFYDEAFINDTEDIELSYRLHSLGFRYIIADYYVGNIGGATLGLSGRNRTLRGVASSAYFNYKLENDINNRNRHRHS